MTNGVIKGTGNSRKLKSVSNFKALYPTYDSFANALVAGTLPVDLGINTAGWSTIGTKLDKANLLADATAALYGLTSSATVNQVLSKASSLITAAQNTANSGCKIQTGTYIGTGTFGANNPNSLTFSFAPKMVMILGYYSNDSTDPIYLANASNGTAREIWCQLMDSLSTEYRRHGGLGYDYSSTVTSGKKSADGKTIFWYCDSSANYQLNNANYTYPYLAIG